MNLRGSQCLNCIRASATEGCGVWSLRAARCIHGVLNTDLTPDCNRHVACLLGAEGFDLFSLWKQPNDVRRHGLLRIQRPHLPRKERARERRDGANGGRALRHDACWTMQSLMLFLNLLQDRVEARGWIGFMVFALCV